VAEPEGAPPVVGRMPKARLRAVRGRLAGVPRWRRVGAAVGAVCLAAVAIGIVVVTELPGSSQGASPAAKSSGSTTVQRRDLVATDTESGTLSYANPQTVFNRLSGTITSLPNVGQLVKPGQTLYHVSGAPVVLFNGTTPAYRDLTSGDSNGPDILQLNRDLRSLGFDPDHQIALNDTWQDATTTAVESWQSALGQTETGTVTLGQIVFLPGPQVITSVDTDLGSTGGASSGSAASATSTADTNVTPHTDFVSLTMAASQASPSTPGHAPASTAVTTPTAAAAPCSQPVVPPSAAGTPTTTTPAPASSCEKTGDQTTTTDTTTTPTTPMTTTSTTSTTPTTPTGPPANIPTKPKSGSRSPSEQAILLALLKAETLELKKSLSASGGSAGGSSRSATGASGSTSSASRSGGGGGAGGGGGSSSASAGTGASSGGAASSGSGDSSGASTAQAILQTTSNQLVVTVDLDATKQSEAVVGEPVTVELPNGNTVNAKIIQVSPVAQSTSSASSASSGSGGASTGSTSAPSATIPVTIKITGRHPASGLDQAAVSVNFEQQVEKNVLSVPVTALLATAGGGYAVQEALAPHTLIAVTPGLFAAGYVQISGAQIYPGLQVTDSQG
jgi:hypothetical protein